MPSLKDRELQVVSGNLDLHPAFEAWQRLTGESQAPARIDSFQDEKAIAKGRRPLVFRLHGVSGGPIIAKRSQRVRMALELQIYTDVLPRIPIDAVRCIGTIAALESPEHLWTFLEDAGERHWLRTESVHRILAARWMGAMHGAARQLAEVSRLPDRGVRYYREHAEVGASNLKATLDRPDVPSDDRRALTEILLLLDRIGDHWDKLEKSAEGPSTLVHGDFVEKNVRVRESRDGLSLIAIDWEVAGCATPAADVTQAGLVVDEEAATEYRRAASNFGWDVSATQLRQLAAAGALFRLISGIYWESSSMGEEYRPRFGWRMRRYRQHLEDAAGFLLNGHSGSRQPS